ncbi:MAG: hypothetical protein ACE5NN_06640 [Candidatus Bathyarchaeia archaeon]
MTCEICGREAASRFCELHETAHKNLLERYEDWKKALNITWTEYLNEVLKNPNTGVWAKEVAQRLLSQSTTE